MLAAWAVSAAALAACFGAPAAVTIEGYADHAMEPFIARDGAVLFFNNRNDPPDRTDLHWAERLSDTRFRYRGLVEGANSPKLDGVPSLARDGTFGFVSVRAYDDRRATLWTGRWDGASVSALRLETGLAPRGFLRFNMDGEIAASGRRFYFTDNDWAPGVPRTSDLRVGARADGAWRRAPELDRWFAALNTPGALEYAPATSEDEREIYFTRLRRPFLKPATFEIMVATRDDPAAPFGPPAAIPVLRGFVEAPTVAPDGALYVHALRDGQFRILRAPRAC